MFMFWSKRTVLTRRLLKAKVRREYETECETQEDHTSKRIISVNNNNNINSNSNSSSPNTSPNSQQSTASTSPVGFNFSRRKSERLSQNKKSTSSNNNNNSSDRKKLCCGGSNSQEDHADDDDSDSESNYQLNDDDDFDGRLIKIKELLKSLKENQLEMLLTSIESFGADLGSCVFVAKNNSIYTANNSPSQSPPPPPTPPPPTTPRQIDNSYCDQENYRRNRRHHPLRHRHSHHFTRQRSKCRHCELRHSSITSDNISDNNSFNDSDINEDANQNNHQTTEGSVTTTTTADQDKCFTNNLANKLLPVQPHLLSCQIWRWPDLAHSSELKKLPVCHSSKDPAYVCCNPYHWSRLCKPESPPPPYCLIPHTNQVKIKGCNQTRHCNCSNHRTFTSFPESVATDDRQDDGGSQQKEWCTLAYWELSGRVGRLYPVETSEISVFDSLHDGDGLCLASLAKDHSSSAAVKKTRNKIGLGLMLSQENDGVWAYNRSGSPIFVNSPTLDDPESRTLLVYRVPPGFCLNIYDRAKSLPSRYSYNDGLHSTGPIDNNSVRISFAKGWGPKYSRQEVTSCPCWLEVLLAPCR